MMCRMSCCAGLRLAAAMGACAGLASAGPIVSSWIGMNGNWTDAMNWSTDPVFPNNGGGQTFAVFIDVDQADYIVTLDQMITITSLDLVGRALGRPTLDLTSNDLVIEGDFLFDGLTSRPVVFAGGAGGTLEIGGQATLRNSVFEGVGSVTSLDSLVFDSDICDDLCDTPLLLQGDTAQWNGSGDIRLLQGGSITVGSATTFTINSAQTLLDDGVGGAEQFVNDGVVVRNAGAAGATTIMGVEFTNNNALRVEGGALDIDGVVTNLSAGTLSGGMWEVSGGSSLNFVGQDVLTNETMVTLRDAGSTFASLDAIQTNGAAGMLTVDTGANLTTDGGFQNDGMLRVGAASTFEVGGALGNQTGGELAGGEFSIAGTLRYDGADIVSLATNVTLDGADAAIVDENDASGLRNFAMIDSGGALTVENGLSFATTMQAGDFTVEDGGLLTVGAGSTFEVDENNVLTNFDNGEFFEGEFDIRGTLRASNAEVQTLGNRVTLDGVGSVIENTDGVDAFNALNLIDTTGRLTLRNGRQLTTQGDLTVLGQLIVENPGGMALTENTQRGSGDPSASIVVGGALTIGERARMLMQIGGPTPGTDFAPVVVEGVVTFDDADGEAGAGRLKIRTLDGFEPMLGDFFDILFYSGLEGGFESIVGLYISPGLRFEAEYLQDRLRLTVAEIPAPASAWSLMAGTLALMRRRR